MSSKLLTDTIKQHVAKHGTLTAVAKRLGVSISYVSLLRRGKRIPSPELANKLGLRVLKTVSYQRKEEKEGSG